MIPIVIIATARNFDGGYFFFKIIMPIIMFAIKEP